MKFEKYINRKILNVKSVDDVIEQLVKELYQNLKDHKNIKYMEKWISDNLKEYILNFAVDKDLYIPYSEENIKRYQAAIKYRIEYPDWFKESELSDIVIFSYTLTFFKNIKKIMIYFSKFDNPEDILKLDYKTILKRIKEEQL